MAVIFGITSLLTSEMMKIWIVLGLGSKNNCRKMRLEYGY